LERQVASKGSLSLSLSLSLSSPLLSLHRHAAHTRACAQTHAHRGRERKRERERGRERERSIHVTKNQAGSAHKHAIERFYRIVDETGIKTRFEELSEELGVKSEEDLEYIQEDDLTNILKEMKVVPERKLRAALKAVHNEL